MKVKDFDNVFLAMCVVSVFLASVSMGEVQVGSGVNSALVYIEWSDGFSEDFMVSFGTDVLDTVVGSDLLFTLDSELPDFTFLYSDYGTPEQPNLFIDGIEYLDHSDIGFGGGEDWWHYWLKDAGQADWAEAGSGMSDRIVANGDSDGWIYGRATIPEPTTIALLGLGGLLLRRKK